MTILNLQLVVQLPLGMTYGMTNHMPVVMDWSEKRPYMAIAYPQILIFIHFRIHTYIVLVVQLS